MFFMGNFPLEAALLPFLEEQSNVEDQVREEGCEFAHREGQCLN